MMNEFALTLNRNLLKSAIMGHRTFSCAYTGKGLDVRRSVLIMVDIVGGKRASEVMDGEAFDAQWSDEKIASVMMAQPDGSTFEVWDGRKLNSRNPRQQELGYSKFATGNHCVEENVPPQVETLF